MRILLLLPLLLMSGSISQKPSVNQEGGPLFVTSFKLMKDRKPIENAATVTYTPAPEMNSTTKALGRQDRANMPAGERDPNTGTIDARSAELDRIVQESRESPPVAGFTYLIKVQNGSGKTTQIIFWEYLFREVANPANVTRRQFLCTARINPEKGKDLQAFSLLGPSNVIDVKSLSKASANQFEEGVLINRVEFVDGTFWERPGWDINELKLTPRARSETRNMPACRSL